MKIQHLFLAILVLVLATLGCRSSTLGATSEPVGVASMPTEVKVEEETQAEPFVKGPGIASLKLLTGQSGVGEKPLLRWEAVSGANFYQLVVFDEAGKPYWAWEGKATQIYLGGTQEQPPADSSGPVIGSGYSWIVIAYNAEHRAIASSEKRPISP